MQNSFRPSRLSCAATVIALAAMLTACFGGGGDDESVPPVTSEVPASASTSSAGFIAYLMALVVSAADGLEPVDTSMVTPTADDTSEPVSLN